jgi:DNA repair exonuclease SbcCD ATPase subunit
MPSEEKQKINVWIPGSLWKQIGSLGFDSPTKATIAAFEALVLQETKGSNQEALGSSQEDFRKLQEEIGRYQEKVKDLEARPDLATFAQLQARYEGLQEIIREKDRSIERLENDIQKAGQREEDLKQMYNNYMRQVQTLINQSALGTGATRKEESKPPQKRSPDREPEIKPEVVQGEKNKEVVCLNCGKVFTAARSTRLYCSGACKEAYRRKRKKNNQP